MPHLLALIEQYGLPLVFANVFFEQLGAPIPAYPSLVLTGALFQSGSYSWVPLLLGAVSAAAMADCLWYAAGKRYGRKVLATLCRISLSENSCVRQTQSLYSRWGVASLLVAKFIPGFSSISSALAGASGTRFATFVVFDSMGTCLWAGSALYFGSLFSSSVDDLLGVLGQLGIWGTLLVGIALAAFAGKRWMERKRFLRSLRDARISPDELRALQTAGVAVMVVDGRPVELQTDGRIPGAAVLTIDKGSDPAIDLGPLAR